MKNMTEMRYDSKTIAIRDDDHNIYATVREKKKRGGRLSYVVEGYGKHKGLHPKHEGEYEARTKEDAIVAAKSIAMNAA